MAGNNDERLVRRQGLMKPKGFNRVVAQQMPLAPWGVTIPLRHVSPSSMVVGRREVEVSTCRRLRSICESGIDTFALHCLAFVNLNQH